MTKIDDIKQEIHQLGIRLEQARVTLTGYNSAINGAKIKKQEVLHELLLLKRQKEGNATLSAQYEKKRKSDEALLNTQFEKNRQQESDLSVLVESKKSLQKEMKVFKANTAKRDAQEAKRIQKAMDMKFKDGNVRLKLVLAKLKNTEKQLANVTSLHEKLNTGIVELQKQQASSKANIDVSENALIKVKASVVKLEVQEQSALGRIGGYQDQEVAVRTTLEDLQKQIVTSTNTIGTMKKSENVLDKTIKSKQKKYDSLDTKLIAMATKENGLSQRESFIKAKYKQAGIQYQ